MRAKEIIKLLLEADRRAAAVASALRAAISVDYPFKIDRGHLGVLYSGARAMLDRQGQYRRLSDEPYGLMCDRLLPKVLRLQKSGRVYSDYEANAIQIGLGLGSGLELGLD